MRYIRLQSNPPNLNYYCLFTTSKQKLWARKIKYLSPHFLFRMYTVGRGTVLQWKSGLLSIRFKSSLTSGRNSFRATWNFISVEISVKDRNDLNTLNRFSEKVRDRFAIRLSVTFMGDLNATFVHTFRVSATAIRDKLAEKLLNKIHSCKECDSSSPKSKCVYPLYQRTKLERCVTSRKYTSISRIFSLLRIFCQIMSVLLR